MPVSFSAQAEKLQVAATPAGLWELAPSATPDLLLTVTDTSPLDLARSAMQGDRPAVRIEGDVQFAAEVNWLVDHVRWDVEEDLSRFVGDAAAHTLVRAASTAAHGLRAFVGKVSGGSSARPDEGAPTAGESSGRQA